MSKSPTAIRLRNLHKGETVDALLHNGLTEDQILPPSRSGSPSANSPSRRCSRRDIRSRICPSTGVGTGPVKSVGWAIPCSASTA